MDSFMKNVNFLGRKYFRFKNKDQFTRKGLMKALGYTSGNTYVQWNNGVRPSKERLKDIAFLISDLILEKEFISVDISAEQLLNDNIEDIIQYKSTNNFENVVIRELSFNERRMISVYRQVEESDKKMIDTFFELVIEQVMGMKRLESEYKAIKLQLLNWINQKLIS